MLYKIQKLKRLILFNLDLLTFAPKQTSMWESIGTGVIQTCNLEGLQAIYKKA